MTITVKVIADSVSPEGIRLTTMQLRYPRIIHSELMTHRVFSRNASSSRAIPVKKQIHDIIADAAEPVEWGSAQKGMQAGAPLVGWRLQATRLAWHGSKLCALLGARIALWAGAHKQIANRILEPWSHISVVVTSTDWANWFALRKHEDADPTIRELAALMYGARLVSQPDLLEPGEWHLPYIDDQDRQTCAGDTEDLRKASAARCARVSYLNHDGYRPRMSDDLALYDRLAGSDPKHASPLEHQATPDKLWSRNRWAKPDQHGNFRGWRQHRKMVPGEAIYD